MSNYAVAMSNGRHFLYLQDEESGDYVDVEWDFDIARQALIDLGSTYMWVQIFPNIEVPQEIIDAENAEKPGAQSE